MAESYFLSENVFTITDAEQKHLRKGSFLQPLDRGMRVGGGGE